MAYLVNMTHIDEVRQYVTKEIISGYSKNAPVYTDDFKQHMLFHKDYVLNISYNDNISNSELINLIDKYGTWNPPSQHDTSNVNTELPTRGVSPYDKAITILSTLVEDEEHY